MSKNVGVKILLRSKYRNRTGALSDFSVRSAIELIHYVKELLVENNGFEPMTPCVQGRCSSQLS